MPKTPETSNILINVKTYAELMGLARSSVWYQLKKQICAVQPIEGTKPPKWRLSDVDEYKRRFGGK